MAVLVHYFLGFFTFIYLVCMHAPRRLCGGRRQLARIHSLLPYGSGYRNPVIRLAGKHLYPLSQLTTTGNLDFLVVSLMKIKTSR